MLTIRKWKFNIKPLEHEAKLCYECWCREDINNEDNVVMVFILGILLVLCMNLAAEQIC